MWGRNETLLVFQGRQRYLTVASRRNDSSTSAREGHLEFSETSDIFVSSCGELRVAWTPVCWGRLRDNVESESARYRRSERGCRHHHHRHADTVVPSWFPSWRSPHALIQETKLLGRSLMSLRICAEATLRNTSAKQLECQRLSTNLTYDGRFNSDGLALAALSATRKSSCLCSQRKKKEEMLCVLVPTMAAPDRWASLHLLRDSRTDCSPGPGYSQPHESVLRPSRNRRSLPANLPSDLFWRSILAIDTQEIYHIEATLFNKSMASTIRFLEFSQRRCH